MRRVSAGPGAVNDGPDGTPGLNRPGFGGVRYATRAQLAMEDRMAAQAAVGDAPRMTRAAAYVALTIEGADTLLMAAFSVDLMVCQDSHMRRTGSPPRPVRDKIMLVAFLGVGLALMTLLAVYAIVVLAGLRPYFAAYWYAGLAAGAVVAIGLPVLSLRAMAKDHHGRSRWPLLLLVGYLGAVLVGIRLVTTVTVVGTRLVSIVTVRIVTQPPSAPSPGAFLVLSSVAFVATGLIVAVLFGGLVLASVVAPEPLRRAQLRWQARQRRRHGGDRRQLQRDGRPRSRRPRRR